MREVATNRGQVHEDWPELLSRPEARFIACIQVPLSFLLTSFIISLTHSLPPLTMSDPLSASPRPTVFPTPSRNPPSPPSSRSVANLFASRGHGATPIPPSLQAKMAAVRFQQISPAVLAPSPQDCPNLDGKPGFAISRC